MAHYHILEGKACFTTHVVHNHAPVFCVPDYFALICDSLTYCRQHRELKVYGYVIMPDHLHLLTSIGTPAQLRDTLCAFRTYTAKNLFEMLAAGKRKWALNMLSTGEGQAVLWEPNYRPVDASQNAFEQKLEYIHANPVRRGFVSRPDEWLYSSARNYLLHEKWPMEVDFIWENWDTPDRLD